MASSEIPVDMLHRLLRYDPNNGKLFWELRTPDMFEDTSVSAATKAQKFNTYLGGKEAFLNRTSKGYLRGRVYGVYYRAHRVIWAMSYGEWPLDPIDHINRDPSDNRICNLRIASPSQNVMNQGLRADNTSGFRGVHYSADRRAWRAVIHVKGRRISLGSFDTAEAAHRAYCEAAKRYHGDFASFG